MQIDLKWGGGERRCKVLQTGPFSILQKHLIRTKEVVNFCWKDAFLLEAASKRWHLNCKRLQDDLHEIWNDATSQLWSCTGGDLLWSTLRASLLFAAAVTRTVRWSSRKAKGVDDRTSGSRPCQQLPGPEVDRHPSSWHCLEIDIM